MAQRYKKTTCENWWFKLKTLTSFYKCIGVLVVIVGIGFGVFGLALISDCGYKKRCGLPVFPDFN